MKQARKRIHCVFPLISPICGDGSGHRLILDGGVRGQWPGSALLAGHVQFLNQDTGHRGEFSL